MYGLLVIAMFGGWSVLHKQTAADTAVRMNQAFSDRLDKLWVIAQEALQDKKYLRAEKALLTILRVDERNATAYNRLGILLTKVVYKYKIIYNEFDKTYTAEGTKGDI